MGGTQRIPRLGTNRGPPSSSCKNTNNTVWCGRAPHAAAGHGCAPHLFAEALAIKVVASTVAGANEAGALPGLLAVVAALGALDARAAFEAKADRAPARWAGVLGSVAGAAQVERFAGGQHRKRWHGWLLARWPALALLFPSQAPKLGPTLDSPPPRPSPLKHEPPRPAACLDSLPTACPAHPRQPPQHSLLAGLAVGTAEAAVGYESRAGHAAPVPQNGQAALLAVGALPSAVARQAALFNGVHAAG